MIVHDFRTIKLDTGEQLKVTVLSNTCFSDSPKWVHYLFQDIEFQAHNIVPYFTKFKNN